MIKINFNPRFDGDKLTAEINDTTLTVNGTDYDLSEIPDGATVDHPVVKNCTRNGNNFELTITLTHGANAPHETRFPTPVEITADTWELNYIYEPEAVSNDLAE